MANIKMLEIDKNKLRAAFIMRGIKSKDAAKAIGVCYNYFNVAYRRGSISEICANALEYKFGILRSEYVVSNDAKLDKDENSDELYAIVFRAVKAAIAELF